MGYDKNYEPYMQAFGVPSIILSMILGWSETMIVTELNEKSKAGNKVYSFKTITGMFQPIISTV